MRLGVDYRWDISPFFCWIIGTLLVDMVIEHTPMGWRSSGVSPYTKDVYVVLRVQYIDQTNDFVQHV